MSNKKNHKKTQILIAIIILIIATVIVMPAEAGIQEFLKRLTITGRATTSNVQINISLGNSVPNITYVSVIAAQDVTEEGVKPVIFYFTANDSDGYQNIDATTAKANFTYRNASTLIKRTNDTCKSLGNIDAKTLNFSCTIGLWYFDTAGVWNITAYVEDVSGAKAQNRTASFTLSPTKAFKSGPGNLTFTGVGPGTTNTTPTNNPLTINNTGNFAFGINNISVNARDLVGETNAAYALYARNFTIGITQGGSPLKECGGVNSSRLIKSGYQNITNATLPYGNLSLGGGRGQEGLYLCLTLAGPELISQAYSTTGPSGQGAWTVTTSVA